ncbi:uncharacterized protein [Emydura macquarii macquarii]|uniref:uncharacterized protein n=1 Tax=Emydura macquarii macquarii TaxID=1129001 RepID=UPI003529E97B
MRRTDKAELEHLLEAQAKRIHELRAFSREATVKPVFAVAGAAEKGQLSKDPGQSEDGKTESYFTWTSERKDRNASWLATNTATSAGEGLTTANATVLITVKDITRNKTRGSASSSIKYWVPPAFMVTALITLYFTYRKSTETESRSRAGSDTLYLDSDSQDSQAVHGAAHVLPHPEAWNQTDEGTLQAKESLSTEETAQVCSDPDPSPGQARSH